tara:strand:- start:297 stop:605 length:309 start_codon:yes stop_codon:yes gene_type:complete
MATVIDPSTGEEINIEVSFSQMGSKRFETKSSNGDIIFLDVRYGVKPSEPLYQDRDWLLAEYSDNDRTMADIAQQFDVTPMTIYAWLRKHSIPTRGRGRKSL